MNSAVNPPETIYLKDYTLPTFAVRRVALDIRVFDDHTLVSSELEVERQSAGDLQLLGRDLKLQSIRVDGELLSSEQYQLDSEQLILSHLGDKATII